MVVYYKLLKTFQNSLAVAALILHLILELHCRGMFSVLAATGEQLDDVRQRHAPGRPLNREITSVEMTNDWL